MDTKYRQKRIHKAKRKDNENHKDLEEIVTKLLVETLKTDTYI